MSDVIVIAVGISFAGMGLVALATPAFVLAQFGVPLETANGRNEVRAVYGGFGLAMAAALIVAATAEPSTRDGIVVATAVALGGMAAGRVVGALVERPHGLYPVWTYFAIEVGAAAALVAAV